MAIAYQRETSRCGDPHLHITTDGPTAQTARDQSIRTGDLIISRANDASIEVRPGTGHLVGDRVDQVRNGNRWRVAAVDAQNNRIAAERLTDNAQVVFSGDYLREQITWGYAVTVHSAQGVTADTAHAVIGEGATRAMACVAMSRGRDNNQAYIYTRLTGEADHEHTRPVTGDEVHEQRRGTKYSAAHYLRAIAANDQRPHTMHTEPQQTDREMLPDIVSQLLDRHDQRHAARREAWRRHSAAARDFRAAYVRLTAATDRTAERSRDSMSTGSNTKAALAL